MTTSSSISKSSNRLAEYYGCGSDLPEFKHAGKLSESDGYFRFGEDVICYGQTIGKSYSSVREPLFDASPHAHKNGTGILLPFDLTRVVDNLRYELYPVQSDRDRWVEKAWTRNLYYLLRPMFPVSFRKHLQRVYLRDRERMPFPNWPVDRSVDMLFEKLLALVMEALSTDRLPFIWFWPEGHSASAIMTHDVETTAGRDFCSRLMDIDDSFGVKASFQIVPERRYAVPPAYLDSIRERGFEINVQGLNHNGTLFRDRKEFLRCAEKINQYAIDYGALGFRSPVLYRNLNWLSDLRFSYDMTVPNVGHLDPQPGGCCTIMPYVLPGGMTELPLTTIQDYSLFHVLNEYSDDLWSRQIRIIQDGHGLMSFLVHPDYVAPDRAQGVYQKLLERLGRLRSDDGVWVTLPKEVDRWWRERSQMTMVPEGKGWRIEGPNSDRARLAFARFDKGRLVYEVESK